MQFGDHTADVGGRGDHGTWLWDGIAGGGGDQVHRPGPAVDGAGQVLVDGGDERLGPVRGLPGDQAPRRGHGPEPGVSKRADPARRRVRPLLEMGRPLDHRGVTDDHRFVGLICGDRPLSGRSALGPGENRETAQVLRPAHAGQHVQHGFGGTVARMGPPPESTRVEHGRNRRQGAGRRHDNEVTVVPEIEGVEHGTDHRWRTSQSTDARCSIPTRSMTSAPTSRPSRARIAAPISASLARSPVSASRRSSASVRSSSAKA